MEKSIRFKASSSSSLLLAFLLMAMMMMNSVITASEPEEGCTETLMAISPCLPYISSSPNNLSSSASTLCCEFFSAASDSGNATCLCYLIRQPFIFGFPLNTTRISSLFFVCPLGNELDPGTRTPLDSLCEVSENSPSPMPTLPNLAPSPVPSLATATVPGLAPAPVPSISASHMPSLPQEPAASSPTPMSPSVDIGTDSSTSDPVSSSSSARSSTSEPVCYCSYYFLHGIIMLSTVYIIMLSTVYIIMYL